MHGPGLDIEPEVKSYKRYSGTSEKLEGKF